MLPVLDPLLDPNKKFYITICIYKQFDEDCQGCRRHLPALDSLDAVYNKNHNKKSQKGQNILSGLITFH